MEIVAYQDPLEGVACVTLDYDCSEPSFVTLDLGKARLVTYDAAATGDLAPTIPRAPCIDTTAFPDGFYTLQASATCPGGTTYDWFTVEVDNPSFKLGSFGTADYEYNRSDIVTLELDAGVSGLEVSADFSEVDSDYLPGAEAVVDNADGTYTIFYMLSDANTRPIGHYSVDVTLADGAVERTERLVDVIRYAPNSTPRIAMVGDLADEIIFADPPLGEPGTIEVSSASLTRRVIRISAQTDLTIQIHTHSMLDDDTVILRIGEVGGDGYIKAVAPAINGSCGLSGCDYDVEVPLSLRPFAGDTLHASGQSQQLEIGVSGSMGGVIVDGPPIPGPPSYYLPLTEGPYTVIGKLWYTRMVDQPGNFDHEYAPQYASGHTLYPTTPIVDQVLVLRDGCGDEHLGRTYADGSFALVYDLECADPPGYAHLYLRGEAVWSYLNVEVTDLDENIYQVPVGLSFMDDTFNLVTDSVGWSPDTVTWGAIAITQQAARTQRAMKEYLVGNSPILGMPRLTVHWEDGQCVSKFSSYNGEWVRLCGAEGNPDHMDEWAQTHEYFHWYQDHFMPDLKGNGSMDTHPQAGAFGEAFATMMPQIVTGHRFYIKKWDPYTVEAEDLDFNGNLKEDANGGPKEAVVPWDLYETMQDNHNGGWSWRIMYDFYDFDGGELGAAEPVTAFAAEWYKPGSSCEEEPVGSPMCPRVEMGDLDRVGTPDSFDDVIRNYLGGGLILGNLPDGPNNATFNYDKRGYKGVEMTEFLDGALCRSTWNDPNDLVTLVGDVMGFTSYDPGKAPTNCP